MKGHIIDKNLISFYASRAADEETALFNTFISLLKKDGASGFKLSNISKPDKYLMYDILLGGHRSLFTTNKKEWPIFDPIVIRAGITDNVERHGGLDKERTALLESLEQKYGESLTPAQIKGVYVEQASVWYVEKVLSKILPNLVSSEKVKLDSASHDPYYDAAIELEVKEGLYDLNFGNLLKIDFKSNLDNFSITKDYVKIDEEDIKQIDFKTLGLENSIKILLLKQKFENNYPVYADVRAVVQNRYDKKMDSNYILSSEILSSALNMFDINNFKAVYDIHDTAQQIANDIMGEGFTDTTDYKKLVEENEELLFRDALQNVKTMGAQLTFNYGSWKPANGSKK